MTDTNFDHTIALEGVNGFIFSVDHSGNRITGKLHNDIYLPLLDFGRTIARIFHL